MELSLVPPSSDSLSGPASAGDTTVGTEPEPDRPELFSDPVLFMGTRSGSGATLVPVARLSGDSLLPLPSSAAAPDLTADFVRTRLAPGSEFVLFAEGARVGRLTATEVTGDPSFCGAPAAVSGVLELVPEAASARRFIALSHEQARGRSWSPYRAPDHTYDQRVAGLTLARDLVTRLGAPWPGSLLEARRDMQAFTLGETGAPGIAATFLFQDRLAVGEAPDEAWALFLMAVDEGSGYTPAHSWYRMVGEGGKAAPRFFQHADWDGDGESEVLLEVLGARGRWAAALDRRGGEWRVVHQGGCGG